MMTDETKGRGERVDETARSPDCPAPNGAPSPRDMADFQVEATPEADPIAAIEAEKADLKDKLLRALAEMENLRRRTEREVGDARTYAVTAFARDMLNVADNLARALASAPPAEDDSATLKALREGVELTDRDLRNTLSRHGVRKLEPEGQKFDPNFHQAMFEVPNPELPKGTVVTVVQAGYAIGDRVLRSALVGVSTGGPKPASGGA
jgi:molecular chaperone GrpE